MFLSSDKGGTRAVLGPLERANLKSLDNWVTVVSSFYGTQQSSCLSLT
jgi:hypothetical protein